MTFFMLVLVGHLGSVLAETNLAEGKPTSVSTRCNRCWLSDPAHVVDGSRSAKFASGTCFNTEVGDLHPWWQVDLQHTYLVTHVYIVGSDRVGQGLHDFAIEVFNHKPTKNNGNAALCHYYKGVFKPYTGKSVNCDHPISGRFVRLSGKKTKGPDDKLTLCEVMVYDTLQSLGAGETYYQGQYPTWAAESVVTYKMTKIQCAVTCMWTPGCASFNTPLKDDGTYCEILTRVKGQASGKTMTGWKRIRLMS